MDLSKDKIIETYKKYIKLRGSDREVYRSILDNCITEINSDNISMILNLLLVNISKPYYSNKCYTYMKNNYGRKFADKILRELDIINLKGTSLSFTYNLILVDELIKKYKLIYNDKR